MAIEYSSTTNERVIALVDMDCFYVQVEQRDHPAIKGRPAAVVQFNTHKGGGIIAVNYEARACGVKRGMRGTEAQELCPEIQLVRVPMQRNKANLQKYRNAGKEVIQVLCRFCSLVERASIDEAFLDLTSNVDETLNRWLAKMEESKGKEDFLEATDDLNTNFKDQHAGSTQLSFLPEEGSLKSTWVELEACDDAFDLDDPESRREYEMNETVVSDWKPGPVIIGTKEEKNDKGGSSGREKSDEFEVVETEEKIDDGRINGDQKNNKEESEVTEKEEIDERNAVRQKGLNRWLKSLRTSLLSCSDTCSSYPLGLSRPTLSELRLLIAAQLCEEMREAVYQQTGFRCSAGIAHNKILAKLVCGLHKPNQQTVLPARGIPHLWQNTPINKVRNLGGKLGASLVETFGCSKVSDLSALTLPQLKGRYDDKTALWLYNIGKGEDREEVVPRQLAKSVGCGKNFLGRETLHTRKKVVEWTTALVEELAERLQEDQDMNKRIAKTLTVSFRTGDSNLGGGYFSGTRSCPLTSYSVERIAKTAFSLLSTVNTAKDKEKWSPPLHNISLSAGKFEDSLTTNMPKIQDMFKKVAEKQAAGPAHPSLIAHQSPVIAENSQPPLPKGIMSYFVKSEGDKTLNPTVNENASVDKNESEAAILDSSTKDTKKSFFQRFLMKKTDSCTTNESISSAEETNLEAAENFEDAIDILVDQLDSDAEEVEDNTKSGYSDSIYDASTDEEQELNTNQRMTSVQSPQPSTSKVCDGKEKGIDKFFASAASSSNISSTDCVSVTELFPDLGAVDESVIPLLPPNLQRAVKDAVQRHKAEAAGKAALKSSSKLWKYMKDSTVNQNKETKEKRNNLISGLVDEGAGPSKIEKEDSDLENTPPDQESFIACDKCGEKIAMQEYPEHLDYHVARELQRQWNGSATEFNRAGNSQKKRKSSPGQHSQNSKKKAPVNKNNTLDGYFGKR